MFAPRVYRGRGLDVLPRPSMLPEEIGPGGFIAFDAIGAYSVAVRTH